MLNTIMCIESDLNTARMLRKNDSTNLLNKVENKIKNYPGFVKAKIGITPESGYYLLMIQDYLVRHGVHASDDIKSILANVPNEFRYTTPLEISDW